jgi:hypothetical protein
MRLTNEELEQIADGEHYRFTSRKIMAGLAVEVLFLRRAMQEMGEEYNDLLQHYAEALNGSKDAEVSDQ